MLQSGTTTTATATSRLLFWMLLCLTTTFRSEAADADATTTTSTRHLRHNSCIAEFGDCTAAGSTCCAPSTCQVGNPWYSQCLSTPPAPTPSSSTSYSSGSKLSGMASTTRYWDCSGGACGCAYLPSHLGGDVNQPAHCYSNSMFSAPPNNKYGATFYGSAAVSQALGGTNWQGPACGKCFLVTGTANSGGLTQTTTVVLKATNYCPPENWQCANGRAHFDISAPGYDYAPASLSNSCATREPNEPAFSSCGNGNVEDCDCNLFHDVTLQRGCSNFQSLGWDNPNVQFEELDDCPPEMVTPCWKDNGNAYPAFGSIPDTCLAPSSSSSVGVPVDAPLTPAAPVPPPAIAGVLTPGGAGGRGPTPTFSGNCVVQTRSDANSWWAALDVGFDSPTATLDFSNTGLDLGSLTKLEKGNFLEARLNGQTITLTKAWWMTSTTLGYFSMSANNNAALTTFAAPACNPI